MFDGTRHLLQHRSNPRAQRLKPFWPEWIVVLNQHCIHRSAAGKFFESRRLDAISFVTGETGCESEAGAIASGGSEQAPNTRNHFPHPLGLACHTKHKLKTEHTRRSSSHSGSLSHRKGTARPNELFPMGPLRRLYERYDFSASAMISDASSAETPARVSNISYGGCRLLTNASFPIEAEVTVKIRTADAEFEAPAKVVHSTENAAGVMFVKFTPEALFVLQKWIQEVRYIQSTDAAE